jgi:hypothetical protein
MAARESFYHTHFLGLSNNLLGIYSQATMHARL